MPDLILAFDTETTGLPIWSEPSDAPGQPHIVSLAMELCQPDGTVIDTYDQIVNIGVKIPPETVAIHGITDEMAAAGIAPTQMLEDFHAWVARAGLLTGFNVTFDMRMMRIQAARHTGAKWETPIPYFDTCFAAKDVCKIPAKRAGMLKKPNLTEAMSIIFGETHDNAHQALADTSAARRLYFRLRDTMEPMLPKSQRDDDRTVGDILNDLPPVAEPVENPRAVIGGNMPPEVTPLEAHTTNINDIEDEARNWLDGAPIDNQGQADDVTRLLDMAKKAGKAADAQRVIEKKPHDDAAKAVQAAWKPLIDKAERIETSAKGAVGKWLLKQRAEQRAIAETARLEAAAKTAEALKVHQEAAGSGDLAALESAEQSIKDAKVAHKDAARADAAKPAAKVEGMARAVGLTTVWDVALSGDDGDVQALAKHYWQTRRADVVEFYMNLARTDVRGGARAIPGTIITPRQVAR